MQRKATKNKATKNKVPAKAKAILEKVRQVILEEPNRLNMDTWAEFFNPELYSKSVYNHLQLARTDGRLYTVSQKLPPCGTTACIGGHSILQSSEGVKLLKRKKAYKTLASGLIEIDFNKLPFPEKTAQKILGITKDQANRIFYLPEMGAAYDADGKATGWPEKFAEPYHKAKTAKQRAKITAARISYFIETGE